MEQRLLRMLRQESAIATNWLVLMTLVSSFHSSTESGVSAFSTPLFNVKSSGEFIELHH